jgi:molybdopterin converting factor small subunit
MTQHSEQLINVQIQFEAQLRELVSQNPMTVQCPDNATVEAALRHIDSTSPVHDRLFTTGDLLSTSLLVFLNDQPVSFAAIGSVCVNDGDVLLLYPPISGG